jgi:hypothetical protein
MAYHAALEIDLDEATELIARVERSAAENARRSLASVADRLLADGHRVVGVAVAASNTAPPTDLAKILASHSSVHAAEGELYREALVDATDALGFALTRFPNKHAISEAAAALRVDTDAQSERLGALRTTLGPPWQKDHREATAAALLVLAR